MHLDQSKFYAFEDEERLHSDELDEEDSLLNIDKTMEIKVVGKIENEKNCSVINEYYEKQIHYCLPRPELQPLLIKRAKTPWVFQASAWSTKYGYLYEGENEVFA
jgi:hypothetical protein